MAPATGDKSTILLCKWQGELTEALLDLGARIFVVLDDFDVEHMNPDWDMLAECAHVYRVSSFDSLAELAAVATDLIVKGVPVDEVVSHVEFSQFGAGYLELLLWPGATPSRVHVAARDKRLMKQLALEAGIPAARWASISDPGNAADVQHVADVLEFPIVVKPVAGLGTTSTLRISSHLELQRAMSSFSFDSHVLRGRHLIAEEFVAGRELHIDAVWVDGAPLFLTIAAYQRPRLSTIKNRAVANAPADGSHIVPEEDATELYAAITDLHARLNQALGISKGATHLEVFETDSGELYFSEIATRPGGGWAPDLLSAYLGKDYWRVVAEATVTGGASFSPAKHKYVGAVHLVPDRPGRIVTTPSDQELAARDGVLGWRRFRHLGDTVDFASAAEWCVFVVLGADSWESYQELSAAVAKDLRIGVKDAG